MLREKYNQLKEKYSGNEAVLALITWLGLADQSGNEDYQELRSRLIGGLGARELEKWQSDSTYHADRAIEDNINMAVMVELMADAPMAE